MRFRYASSGATRSAPTKVDISLLRTQRSATSTKTRPNGAIGLRLSLLVVAKDFLPLPNILQLIDDLPPPLQEHRQGLGEVSVLLLLEGMLVAKLLVEHGLLLVPRGWGVLEVARMVTLAVDGHRLLIGSGNDEALLLLCSLHVVQRTKVLPVVDLVVLSFVVLGSEC